MSGCGTYAGYQRHKKRRDEPCADCRRANADYHREARKSAVVRRREYEQGQARQRAYSRLADMHPALYRALYEEELTRKEGGRH